MFALRAIRSGAAFAACRCVLEPITWSAVFISINAKLAPMQRRTPLPNGIQL